MRSGGFSTARLARTNDVMTSHVELGEMPGLVTLVSRRGAVHVDAIGAKAVGGDEPMLRDTIFRLASATKPITAAAAMVLVEECRLRLDDPVDEFLPELADRQVLRLLDGPLDETVPANRPITLRDLLTFRLGFGLIFAELQSAFRFTLDDQSAVGLAIPDDQSAVGLAIPDDQSAVGVAIPDDQSAVGVTMPDDQSAFGGATPDDQSAARPVPGRATARASVAADSTMRTRLEGASL